MKHSPDLSSKKIDLAHKLYAQNSKGGKGGVKYPKMQGKGITTPPKYKQASQGKGMSPKFHQAGQGGEGKKAKYNQ